MRRRDVMALAAAVWEARRLLAMWKVDPPDPDAMRREISQLLDSPEVLEALDRLSAENGEQTPT